MTIHTFGRARVTCILSMLLYACGYSAASFASDIRIGVLAVRGAEKAMQMWEPTADYLSEKIDGYSFSIVPVTNSNIVEKMEAKAVHFTLTNPALYASLENTQGISRIATLKTKQLGQPYTEFGSVIFTRSDRQDLGSLTDIKNKSFMAVHPRAFGGWWMALYEFQKIGINPERHFSDIRWAGFPQDNIVFAVLNGEVDAGTVRTNIIERLAFDGKIKLSDVRVLNAQTKPGFPFLLSTPLYPEWAFAAVKDTPPDVAKQVAIELLSLPGDSAVAIAANSDGWTVPLDYQPVHRLMRKLHVGPYKGTHEAHSFDVVRDHPWLLAILLSLLVVALTVSVFRNRKMHSSKMHLQTIVNAHSKEKGYAIDELEKRNVCLEKLLTLIDNSKASPSDKLSRLLLLACDVFGLEQASVEKVDQVDGKFYVLEQVLGNEKMAHIISQVNQSNTKQFLSLRALAVDDVVTLRDLSDTERDQLVTESGVSIRSYFGAAIHIDGQQYGILSFIGVSDACASEIDMSEKTVSWRILFIRYLGYLISQLIEKEMLMQRLTVEQDNNSFNQAC